MAKKNQPTEQFDPEKVAKLKAQKSVDRLEGQLDRNAGRDTRMSRDGGTSRRTRR